MAYFSKERKEALLPDLKEHCKKFGIKATFAVRHHSTLVINISSGQLDFESNIFDTCDNFGREWEGYTQVNPYHYESHFSGVVLYFLNGLLEIANRGNWNRSDLQTDYFDVGWYVDVNIGKYDKPYKLVV